MLAPAYFKTILQHWDMDKIENRFINNCIIIFFIISISIFQWCIFEIFKIHLDSEKLRSLSALYQFFPLICLHSPISTMPTLAYFKTILQHWDMDKIENMFINNRIIIFFIFSISNFQRCIFEIFKIHFDSDKPRFRSALYRFFPFICLHSQISPMPALAYFKTVLQHWDMDKIENMFINNWIIIFFKSQSQFFNDAFSRFSKSTLTRKNWDLALLCTDSSHLFVFIRKSRLCLL
jgi:hypothetical protein